MSMLSSLGTKIGTTIKTLKTNLESAIALKVDSTRVLTDVPIGAKFTDTTYSTATTTVSGLMSNTDKVKLDGIQGGTAGKLSGIPMSFHCERNGVSSIGDRLSWGNGTTGNIGIVMPFNGKIIQATLSCTGLTGTQTFQLLANGTLNTNYQLSATGNATNASQNQNWQNTPLSFTAGNTITWQSVVAPSISTSSVITFYVIFD